MRGSNLEAERTCLKSISRVSGSRSPTPNLDRPFCVQDIDIEACPLGCVSCNWHYLVGIQGSKGANVIDGEVGVDVGALSIARA